MILPPPEIVCAFEQRVVSSLNESPRVVVSSSSEHTFIVTSSMEMIEIQLGTRAVFADTELRREIRKGVQEGLEPLREVTVAVAQLMRSLSTAAARIKRGTVRPDVK